MKRALAERAKQQGRLPNGVVSNASAPSSTASSQPPPLKLPRTTSSTNNHRPSPRGKAASLKRQRSLEQPESEEEEEDEGTAFYLKHQNRALASELRQLQYQLQLLTRERDFRRTQCQNACQALNSLQATWTQLETALMQPALPNTPQMPATGPQTHNTPISTGAGESVEMVSALLRSLSALGRPAPPTLDEGWSQTEQQQLWDLSTISLNISQRANALQTWIHQHLQKKSTSLQTSSSSNAKTELLQSQLRDAQTQIQELAKARDAMAASDRLVRKALYRLAAGRVQLKEVLKVLDDSDRDGIKLEEALLDPITTTATTTTSSVVTSSNSQNNDDEQVQQLQKQLGDLEQVAASRETRIEELLGEREELLKRINELSVATTTKAGDDDLLSDENVKRSSLYTDTMAKLTTAQRQLEETTEKLQRQTERLAQALGDAELARKTLEDLRSKHHRRWCELTGTDYDQEEDETEGSVNHQSCRTEILQQARLITEKDHKLQQALENVRQAESIRKALEEAVSMNETLQGRIEETGTNSTPGKIEEIKGKYTQKTGSSTPRGDSSSKSDKYDRDKLYRENKRMKKELATLAAASKETKRMEKERDSLLQSNSRLLKQSSEKDDMNAKSLSTILHLKHLTEQLTEEKQNLEQQAKSAKQLVLTTRLATNAKARVVEEAMRERKNLEAKVSELEKKCSVLQKEKETADAKLSQAEAEMVSLSKDMNSVRERCDELASESTQREDENRKMMESLAVAKREAVESAEKIAKLNNQRSGGGSDAALNFTPEQLSTQVSVLKSRLACPVCNHRDKKCILLRCRHMFCKQCVEENIKNRSRKCPACGQRFDNKDVGDVWL